MKPHILPALVGLLLASPPGARAEERSGSAEVVGQAVRGDTNSNKFDEYRDIHRGVYLERLSLDLDIDARYLRLDLWKPGLKDQRLTVEGGEWGLHKLSLSYDQIPHNLSNTAKTYLVNERQGTFTLPDNMQSSMQTSTANAAGFLSHSPGVPLRVDRKKGSVAYLYNPAGRWRVNLAYSGEKREGNKVFGMAYGHGQVQEALEPVDYMTHDVLFGGEYAGERLAVNADYRFSAFENDIKALTVDNPFQLADSALSASGSSTPGKARAALSPDNQTHQANLGLSAKVNSKNRLTLALGYTLQRQDDPFLPLTSNLNILNDPRLPGLPADSLRGEVHTLNAAGKWNWKPVDAVSLNVHAKRYDVENKTPELVFQQYVSFDTSFSTTVPTAALRPTRTRAALPIDYAKTNLGADLYYALAKALSMKLAYDWERWERDFREAEVTKEDTYTVSFKAGPAYGLVLRPSYQYARKTVEGYSAERVAEETFPLGEGTSLGQIEQLRKFDEAGRKRHKATVRAEWDRYDFLGFGLEFGWAQDDYSADYGLQHARTVSYSADMSANPFSRVSLYADYTFEQMTSRMRSRYRVTGLDVVDNDWVGTFRDDVHTVNAGASCAILPEKLDADLGWSLTYAKGQQRASNPNNLAGTASQKAAARATDFPNTYTRWHKARASLRYRWLKNVTAKLGYEYQRYTETDWSQDDLNVYQPVWNKSVFLGATQGGYEAHLASLGFSYLF